MRREVLSSIVQLVETSCAQLGGEVARFFLWTRTADRDDADRLMSISDENGPCFLPNLANHLMARFVEAPSGDL